MRQEREGPREYLVQIGCAVVVPFFPVRLAIFALLLVGDLIIWTRPKAFFFRSSQLVRCQNLRICPDRPRSAVFDLKCLNQDEGHERPSFSSRKGMPGVGTLLKMVLMYPCLVVLVFDFRFMSLVGMLTRRSFMLGHRRPCRLEHFPCVWVWAAHCSHIGGFAEVSPNYSKHLAFACT